MFQNESYSHKLTSLPKHIHEDVGTLTYFLLHVGSNAALLLNRHCTRDIKHFCFRKTT